MAVSIIYDWQCRRTVIDFSITTVKTTNQHLCQMTHAQNVVSEGKAILFSTRNFWTRIK